MHPLVGLIKYFDNFILLENYQGNYLLLPSLFIFVEHLPCAKHWFCCFILLNSLDL